MRRTIFIGMLLVSGICHTAMAQQLSLATIDREFHAESLGDVTPIAGTDKYACLSDDGTQVVECTFNGGQQTAVLFDVHNTIGATIDRFDGFILSADATKMLIQTHTEPIYRRSFKADYYIYTVRTRKLEPLSLGGKQQVPQFSLDGTQVAFVRDNNIYLVKLLYDNAESQVTKDGEANKIINGVPDWVNEEEFSFNSAYCFTADGSKICWLRYDETAVPFATLPLYGDRCATASNTPYDNVYAYKYPLAGDTNSTVTAWSYDIKSHRTQQLQLPADAAGDGYVPRLFPTDDASRVVLCTLNRRQDRLCLYDVNPATTLSQLIVEEKAERYIPEKVIPTIKVCPSAILLLSDRSGYAHLYIYNYNGTLLREVGDDGETITDIYGYNAETGDAYFQAASTPFDRYVAVAHKTGKREALTDTKGWNRALFSADNAYFLNTWSDMNSPYVVTARNNKGKVLGTLLDNAALRSRLNSNGYNRREMFAFTTPEGTTLNGWMVKPEGFSSQRQYPVVMYQYSGPGSQQVVNGWHCGSMGQGFDYYLAQEGYVVVCVDGRGTGGRGAAFEKSTYLALGVQESADQVAAAQWLATQSYVDKSRIGIWGWSYGGMITLMAMSSGQEVFNCGVSIAPVTTWRYYDTVYTERFMRTPKENAKGYDVSPLSRVDNLSGALLLCQGTLDDNVPPRNVHEYTDALLRANKDYNEVLYTNRNHSIYGGNARQHLLRQVANWFSAHLMPSSR